MKAKFTDYRFQHCKILLVTDFCPYILLITDFLAKILLITDFRDTPLTPSYSFRGCNTFIFLFWGSFCVIFVKLNVAKVHDVETVFPLCQPLTSGKLV